MKARAMACCGLFGRQIKGLANADVQNYQINFTSSTILALIGAAAELEGATYTGYAAWLFAVGMGALGAREYTASYFKAKPLASVSNDNKSDDEEMHSAEEIAEKLKKSL
jgi:hypothetical protein